MGLSVVVAALGYRKRALSGSGAVGAVLVGASTYRAGGWRWSALLLGFFASSSALSRRGSASGAEAIAVRGSRRDVVQVLANGGVPCALAALYVASPSGVLAAGYAGAVAAANADTWATEIGGAAGAPPRHILSGAVVPPGTSGGVTVRGLLGALGGAAAIGLVSGALGGPAPLSGAASAATSGASSVSRAGRGAGGGAAWFAVRRGTVVAAAGLVGSLADSVVGGTLQASYRCPACGESTERRVHRCGTPAVLVHGHGWCTNDAVNVICTGVGGAGAMIAEWLLDPGR